MVRGLLDKKAPKLLNTGFEGSRKLRLAVVTDWTRVSRRLLNLARPGRDCAEADNS